MAVIVLFANNGLGGNEAEAATVMQQLARQGTVLLLQ